MPLEVAQAIYRASEKNSISKKLEPVTIEFMCKTIKMDRTLPEEMRVPKKGNEKQTCSGKSIPLAFFIASAL